ncbi:MAG TPA: hypothetical protein VHR66_26295 [Gemmataceae bacterium]|jgi:hypothetical protein|nr:hypothetical protein [Gemmataceae bacterium]
MVNVGVRGQDQTGDQLFSGGFFLADFFAAGFFLAAVFLRLPFFAEMPEVFLRGDGLLGDPTTPLDAADNQKRNSGDFSSLPMM